MATAGTVIAGKYELTRPLGSGSMGDVWVAHHLSLGEDVALKVLGEMSPETAEAPAAAAARFRFEAQVAARLSRRTRHIVRVTDHGEDGGTAYLVMELLEGETLETRLLRGAVPPAQIAKVVAQVARALTEAHAADVIHRDLKPANIFLARDEDGGLLVKLLDFGIARTMRTHRVPLVYETGRGLVFGTPAYMSPEQAHATAPLDHRCDLWALATVAYEALTLALPIPGAQTYEFFRNLGACNVVPIHERDSSLPGALRGFFERAFARRLQDRFGTAVELAVALEHAVESAATADTVATSGTVESGTLAMVSTNEAQAAFRAVGETAGRSVRTPSQARRARWVGAAVAGGLLGLGAVGTALYAVASAKAMAADPPPSAAAAYEAPLPATKLAESSVVSLAPAVEPEPPAPATTRTAVVLSADVPPASGIVRTAPATTPTSFPPNPGAAPVRARVLRGVEPALSSPPPSPPRKPIDKSDVF